MDTSTESATVKSVATKALGFATTALDVGEKALNAKLAVEHAVEDGVRAVRQVARQSRYQAEDLADQAALQVRRNPLQSVGWAFVCGALLGGAALYAIGRKRRPV
jgi:ElaB/YqjD/DUF883 family membrane-anchored ribosome-binding protein